MEERNEERESATNVWRVVRVKRASVFVFLAASIVLCCYWLPDLLKSKKDIDWMWAPQSPLRGSDELDDETPASRRVYYPCSNGPKRQVGPALPDYQQTPGTRPLSACTITRTKMVTAKW